MIMQKCMEKHKWAGLASIPVDDIGFHEVASLFPRLPDPELDALGKNIEENGVKTPILLNFEGLCVDGMNRALACMRMGIKDILFETVDLEEGQLRDYVISLNLHRRHLSEAQRAFIAATLANGTHGGDRTKQQNSALTQKEAAAKFRVSERSVQTAAYVQEHGVEDIQDAVLQGVVAVSAAAAVSSLPPEEQQELFQEGPQAIKKKAKRLREERAFANASAKGVKYRDSHERSLDKAFMLYVGLPVEHRKRFAVWISEEDPILEWLKDESEEAPADEYSDIEDPSVEDEEFQEAEDEDFESEDIDSEDEEDVD